MRERFGLVGLGTVSIPGLGLRRPHVQQAARLSDVVGAGAAGKQAVVANAVEALRQDVDQELRMNSAVVSVMTFSRSRPSAR